MREFRDLAIVALMALLSLVVVTVLYWVTESTVVNRREMRFERALTTLAGTSAIGTVESLEADSLLRRASLEDGGALYEITVTGYREELRFLAGLDPSGSLTGVVLLRDAEGPGYAGFLRDTEEVAALLRGERQPQRLPAGAQVTLKAMSNGLTAAMRHQRGE